MKNSINFIDLSLRPSFLNYKINSSIKNVIKSNKFVMGKQVSEFEKKLTHMSNAKYAVACSNGTDALILSLMSLNVERDDIVFVPTFTFASTAESVAFLGAKPFFVDVLKNSFNMDPVDLALGIKLAKQQKYNIKCIIAVDLFGQACDIKKIMALSKKYNIPIIFDSAQSFGGMYKKKYIGSIGTMTTTSFFPTKPLGCFGDGGAIFTNNKILYKKLLSLRNHGSGKNKYENIYIGMNSRLDTIQAAILLEKIKVLKKEIKMRNNLANTYNKYFKNYISTPSIDKNIISTWAQYSLVLKNKKIRNKLKLYLNDNLIFVNIYYPIPLHMQKAYKQYPRTKNKLIVAEHLSNTILNLPIYPYMDNFKKNKIVLIMLKFIKKSLY